MIQYYPNTFSKSEPSLIWITSDREFHLCKNTVTCNNQDFSKKNKKEKED